MKIKRDFVTNSSSTSFIVAFPKKIETIEDVKEFMSQTKAEVVFKEALEQEPIGINSKEKNELKIINIIESILFERVDRYTVEDLMEKIKPIIKEKDLIKVSNSEYILHMLRKDDNDFEQLDCNIEALTNLIEKSPSGFIYKFNYCDEGSDFWSEMEHGGTFNELPNIAISHH